MPRYEDRMYGSFLGFGAPEWFMFTLSNVIIWYFCGGRLRDDVRRWRG